jgi:hypothetical protein
MADLVSHETDFYEVWYLTYLRNLARKFKLNKILTRITGTLHEDLYTYLITSPSVFLRMKNFSEKFVEKIETHFVLSKFFFE